MSKLQNNHVFTSESVSEGHPDKAEALRGELSSSERCVACASGGQRRRVHHQRGSGLL